MNDRQGVEIDYCQQCRGVWLDRGELDKLIERSQMSPIPSNQHRPPQQYAVAQPHSNGDRFASDYKDHANYRLRKKKGFLGEIFDFD